MQSTTKKLHTFNVGNGLSAYGFIASGDFRALVATKRIIDFHKLVARGLIESDFRAANLFLRSQGMDEIGFDLTQIEESLLTRDFLPPGILLCRTHEVQKHDSECA